MTDLRADSMTGEQWVLEERTADPTSTEEGERWLRADLNSGDKIATLRVDVGTTILNVPVFSSGSAVDVSEAMRVQVNGTTAYVPLAPVSDAAYPELRMQHSGATYGFHDAVEISAIPDSVVDNFENGADGIYQSGETIADYYSGSTADYSRTTSNIVEGSIALGKDATELDNPIVSQPGDGLNTYPDEGEDIGFLLRCPTGSPDPIVLFNASGTGTSLDAYGILLRADGSDWRLTRIDDQYRIYLDEDGTISVGSGWTWIEVSPPTSGDSAITATMYDVDTSSNPPSRGSQISSLSASDGNYVGNRGVGVTSNSDSGTGSILDWYRVL